MTKFFRCACIGIVSLVLAFLPTPTLANNPVTFKASAELTSSGKPYSHLSWRTGDSIQTAGFNLYEYRQPGDLHQKLNAYLIPASGDVIAGGEYSYDDMSVQPNLDYYYELELVDLGGQTQLYGPVKVAAPATPNAHSNEPTPFTIPIWAAVAAVEIGSAVILHASWKYRVRQNT